MTKAREEVLSRISNDFKFVSRGPHVVTVPDLHRAFENLIKIPFLYPKKKLNKLILRILVRRSFSVIIAWRIYGFIKAFICKGGRLYFENHAPAFQILSFLCVCT